MAARPKRKARKAEPIIPAPSAYDRELHWASLVRAARNGDPTSAERVLVCASGCLIEDEQFPAAVAKLLIDALMDARARPFKPLRLFPSVPVPKGKTPTRPPKPIPAHKRSALMMRWRREGFTETSDPSIFCVQAQAEGFDDPDAIERRAETLRKTAQRHRKKARPLPSPPLSQFDSDK